MKRPRCGLEGRLGLKKISLCEYIPAFSVSNVQQQNPSIHQPTAQREPTTSHLTPDEGETVGRQDLVDGLEVGGAAGAAVPRASGGDTLGLATGVERTARVTGLGADVCLGEAGDTALGVVDGRAQGADGAAVDAGGGAGSADGSASRGGGAACDGDVGTTVRVDDALEGGAAYASDVAVVVSGEGGAREGAQGRAGAGGGGAACGTAVAGRDEAGGDGEADGAAGCPVDVVGVTSADGGHGGGHALDGADLELAGDEADLLGEGLGVGGAAGEGLEDELVGGNVDVVGSNARGVGVLRGGQGGGLVDVDAVEGSLGLLELGGAVGDDDGGGTGSGDVSGQGLVSDGDVEGLAVLRCPGTGEGAAGRGLEGLDGLGGGDVAGNTGVSLLAVQSQVALHGGHDLRVQVLRGLGGGTVGDGQNGREEGDELGQLHVEGDLKTTGGWDKRRRCCRGWI